ncbi:MAG: DUF4783 domain-containing protein [Sphingomonadales bacterium]|nr:DUF4783 domain-containing protein [Sphingomonadales bacterium]
MNTDYSRKIISLRASLIVFSLIALVATTLRAQAPAGTSALDRMPNLLKTADFRGMLPYLNSNLEIALQDRKQTCTRSQAEVMLRNFFMKHPPKDFKLIHKGSSGQGGEYLMGTLTSTTGTTFRTTIVFFEKNGQDLVHQLRFE